jgi:hypothetical protein
LLLHHLVYVSKTMLIFILYIIRQVDKYIHLIINMKETSQTKFLRIIPYQKMFFLNLESYFTKTELLSFSFERDNILVHFIVVLDIGIDKLVVVFFSTCSFVLMYLTIANLCYEKCFD